jgi:hypothetical protein
VTAFELPIFPEGSLASSVITTVWVGVLVVCLFNLRFGWVLSGLVVPGYLAPLLIARPVSGVVVIVEAAVTYFLFWLLSEKLARLPNWSSLFGRDRFMGLILVSVLVRVTMDGWLLPIAADWLDASYGFRLDWRSNLHSFGLVILALYANQLWKPGFVRGMVQSLVVLALTCLIIRYGLMEFTNFRISGVLYLYEDFAASVLASPRAYIVLILTCFIASRMNLRYGWDFSGILIPALLALQWYQPLKILTSMVEALVIFAIGTLLLRTRLFAGATIEGARKVLLFFNISFVYKLLLGHALAWAGTSGQITDYYGFGYLLPTLIAIKAHEKGIPARMARAAVQISFVGAVAGSVIGFSLTVLVPQRSLALGRVGNQSPKPTLATLLTDATGAAYAHAARRQSGFDRYQAEAFRSAIGMLDDGGPTAEAAALFAGAGYHLIAVGGGLLAAAPADASEAALLVFNPRSARDLAVVVPHPASQPGLSLAGARLFGTQGARWLVIGGDRAYVRSAEGFVAALPEFRRAAQIPELIVEPQPARARPTLELAGAAAANLDIDRLRAVLPTLAIGFTSQAGADEGANSGRLRIPLDPAQRLIGAIAEPRSAAPLGGLIQQARGVFATGAPTRRAEPARRLSLAELSFLRFEVVEPLLGAIDRGSEAGIRTASIAASTIGFELLDIPDAGGTRLIGLRARSGARGLYVLRRGSAGRPIIQVGADNIDKTIATAARLFDGLGGRALLIAPSQEALDLGEGTLLGLMSQSLTRGAGFRAQLLTQVRTTPVSIPATRSHEYMLASDSLLERDEKLARDLVQQLNGIGIASGIVSGDAVSAGIEVAPNPHTKYMQATRNKRFAILWVSNPVGEAER